jgi:FtsZ-interacting cell division protein ZipA
MKQKIINDMKVVIIILIGVTILFAILGAFNISMKENMHDMDEEPQCYPNSVVDHNYASFNEKENDERYILKTKIVPPKGTACPTEISGPASKYLKDKDKSTTEESSSVKLNSSNSSSVSNTSNLTQNITTENTPSPSESKSSTPESIENKNKPNDSNKPNDMISNNTCPPCPACERCPEPAFDCKKVPNYRSPSIGQYLPMPILNDFSKF